MKLALFDLENTLLSGDSDFEWAQFLISKGVLDREVHEARKIEFYEHYKAGTLDIHAFLDFQLAPLSRHPREELDAWHREFLETRIRPMMTDASRALVRSHLEAGDLCAVVTATNSFVTGPICREFGIEHLIATVPAFEGGPRRVVVEIDFVRPEDGIIYIWPVGMWEIHLAEYEDEPVCEGWIMDDIGEFTTIDQVPRLRGEIKSCFAVLQ